MKLISEFGCSISDVLNAEREMSIAECFIGQ